MAQQGTLPIDTPIEDIIAELKKGIDWHAEKYPSRKDFTGSQLKAFDNLFLGAYLKFLIKTYQILDLKYKNGHFQIFHNPEDYDKYALLKQTLVDLLDIPNENLDTVLGSTKTILTKFKTLFNEKLNLDSIRDHVEEPLVTWSNKIIPIIENGIHAINRLVEIIDTRKDITQLNLGTRYPVSAPIVIDLQMIMGEGPVVSSPTIFALSNSMGSFQGLVGLFSSNQPPLKNVIHPLSDFITEINSVFLASPDQLYHTVAQGVYQGSKFPPVTYLQDVISRLVSTAPKITTNKIDLFKIKFERDFLFHTQLETLNQGVDRLNKRSAEIMQTQYPPGQYFFISVSEYNTIFKIFTETHDHLVDLNKELAGQSLVIKSYKDWFGKYYVALDKWSLNSQRALDMKLNLFFVELLSHLQPMLTSYNSMMTAAQKLSHNKITTTQQFIDAVDDLIKEVNTRSKDYKDLQGHHQLEVAGYKQEIGQLKQKDKSNEDFRSKEYSLKLKEYDQKYKVKLDQANLEKTECDKNKTTLELDKKKCDEKVKELELELIEVRKYLSDSEDQQMDHEQLFKKQKTTINDLEEKIKSIHNDYKDQRQQITLQDGQVLNQQDEISRQNDIIGGLRVELLTKEITIQNLENDHSQSQDNLKTQEDKIYDLNMKIFGLLSTAEQARSGFQPRGALGESNTDDETDMDDDGDDEDNNDDGPPQGGSATVPAPTPSDFPEEEPVDILMGKMKSLKRKVTKYLKDNINLKKILKKTREQFDECEEHRRKHADEIKKFETQEVEFKKTLDEMKQYQSDLFLTQREGQQTKDKFLEFEKSFQTQFKELKDNNTILLGNIKDLQDETQHKTQSIITLRTQLQGKTKELEDLSAQFEAKTRDLTAQLELKTKELGDLSGQFEIKHRDLMIQFEFKNKELGDLSAQLDMKDKELVAQTTQFDLKTRDLTAQFDTKHRDLMAQFELKNKELGDRTVQFELKTKELKAQFELKTKELMAQFELKNNQLGEFMAQFELQTKREMERLSKSDSEPKTKKILGQSELQTKELYTIDRTGQFELLDKEFYIVNHRSKFELLNKELEALRSFRDQPSDQSNKELMELRVQFELQGGELQGLRVMKNQLDEKLELLEGQVAFQEVDLNISSSIQLELEEKTREVEHLTTIIETLTLDLQNKHHEQNYLNLKIEDLNKYVTDQKSRDEALQASLTNLSHDYSTQNLNTEQLMEHVKILLIAKDQAQREAHEQFRINEQLKLKIQEYIAADDVIEEAANKISYQDEELNNYKKYSLTDQLAISELQTLVLRLNTFIEQKHPGIDLRQFTNSEQAALLTIERENAAPPPTSLEYQIANETLNSKILVTQELADKQITELQKQLELQTTQIKHLGDELINTKDEYNTKIEELQNYITIVEQDRTKLTSIQTQSTLSIKFMENLHAQVINKLKLEFDNEIKTKIKLEEQLGSLSGILDETKIKLTGAIRELELVRQQLFEKESLLAQLVVKTKEKSIADQLAAYREDEEFPSQQQSTQHLSYATILDEHQYKVEELNSKIERLTQNLQVQTEQRDRLSQLNETLQKTTELNKINKDEIKDLINREFIEKVFNQIPNLEVTNHNVQNYVYSLTIAVSEVARDVHRSYDIVKEMINFIGEQHLDLPNLTFRLIHEELVKKLVPSRIPRGKRSSSSRDGIISKTSRDENGAALQSSSGSGIPPPNNLGPLRRSGRGGGGMGMEM